MKTEYRKTTDPNVFIKEDTSESFIYLDKLTAEIDEAQQNIDSLPKPKTVPDQEALDFYNMEIDMHGEREMSETQLKEKTDLRDILTSIKAVEIIK